MASISDELLRASKSASEKYGIPTSVILGFAGLETQFGKTGMGKSKNNLFGIGSKTYSSITESVEDYVRLVTGNKDSAQSKKYGNATKDATTIEEWVDAIRDAGYNSEYADGVYEQKVLDVIDTYNLTNHDSDATSSALSSRENGQSVGGLKWWGDIVTVLLAIILVIMGVTFIGLSITSSSTGSKVVKKVKKK